MKLDPFPAAATPEDQQWVEGELVRSLLRSQRGAQAAGVAAVVIVVGVLWSDDQRALTQLLSWAALALLLATLRYGVLTVYRRDVMQRGGAQHLAFFRRWRFLWPLSAFVWGLTTLLYFDRTPLTDQFICWLTLAGLAMYSINSLSCHLGTLRAYLDILAGTALAVLGWRIGVELQFQGPFYHWWLLALLLVFWQVLRHAGARLHATHRRNFELQLRNSQLIESLTRQTQAALDAVEIKNRFLASAAHDIRQPVHALSLYADWLANEPDLVREIAPKIVKSTQAVNQLFDSLFDLARLDSGQIKLNIEPIELVQLLHDLELQYRPLAEAKGLQFRVRSAAGTVVSDAILLRRILGNLISNALRYTPTGGVLLAARRRGGDWVLEVWDTGVGIAPVNQREIFRAFYKVQNHPGTEEGFGLGLYIVSRLTHILGHTLSLASQPGRGTVFRVRLLPCDPVAAAQRASATVFQLANSP